MTIKHKKQILNAILAGTAMVISFAGSAAPLLIIDNTGNTSILGITLRVIFAMHHWFKEEMSWLVVSRICSCC